MLMCPVAPLFSEQPLLSPWGWLQPPPASNVGSSRGTGATGPAASACSWIPPGLPAPHWSTASETSWRKVLEPVKEQGCLAQVSCLFIPGKVCWLWEEEGCAPQGGDPPRLLCPLQPNSKNSCFRPPHLSHRHWCGPSSSMCRGGVCLLVDRWWGGIRGFCLGKKNKSPWSSFSVGLKWG